MPRETSDAVLARIRQLLAKAESTTFEAEALAFSAKAHELMARHAIDQAIVDATDSSPHQGPIIETISLDPPYVAAKALLLQVVAEAGRCRSVFDGYSSSAVVGFADDLAAVELLFTSLLVQAQTALTVAARRSPAGANARSRGFRSAFLGGYTHRIGERLRQINDEVRAAALAERGDAFLPAVRSRSDAVDDVYTNTFQVRARRASNRVDAAGWTTGTAAADAAQVSGGEVARRTA